jgi:hypothetical protein
MYTRQLVYIINSTRYGVKTITGRYDTACTWALWGEDDVQVVNETGVLIHPYLLAKWLFAPGDGSRVN